MEDSENEESHQNVDWLSDCIQAVCDDIKAKTKVVSTHPEPEGKSDAIHVHSENCISQIIGLTPDEDEQNLHFGSSNMK